MARPLAKDPTENYLLRLRRRSFIRFQRNFHSPSNRQSNAEFLIFPRKGTNQESTQKTGMVHQDVNRFSVCADKGKSVGRLSGNSNIFRGSLIFALEQFQHRSISLRSEND